MTAVSSPAKVLVTGANGFIAVWVVRNLLEKGYSVRGTVRSLAKGAHIKRQFESYGDKFELVVVEDITADGAFDEAVKGVDAIEHTASPFHFKAEKADELIGPAVKGTVGILKSTLANGPTVKRVVITSSVAAVLTTQDEPRVFSEKDWNQKSVDAVTQLGDKANKGDIYRGSKTFAERAAWDFVKENEGKLHFDVVALNPPFVFGPAIHDVHEASALGTSAYEWFHTVVHEDMGGKSLDALGTTGSSYVDVRDLARAHVLALEKEAAGGERIIISAAPFTWQDWIDIANSLSPSPIPSHKLPKGKPGSGKGHKHLLVYDTAKATRILGLTYISMEQTTRDTLADFESRGW